MNRKAMLLVAALFAAINLLTAQVTKITGTVISAEDGEPIIGASVVVKGTNIGVATDISGRFVLTGIPASAKILVISFIGMETQEVPVRPELKIVLKPDTKQLEEVVITGYGNFKKSSFTGAASSMDTKKLNDVPALSVASKLAGGTSGVQITSTSGQPGAVEQIRIRGVGSINASKGPLYVIDGVPMLSGNASEFEYSQAGSSLLSTLNSNDIESMTVIKDAAAASLYGSRAANGVIVITTKKGSTGKGVFGVKADWGFSNMAIDYRPVLSGEDRREVLYLGLQNFYLNSGENSSQAASLADQEIDGYAAKPWSGYTDWKDLLYRTGSHQNYEFSAQGGNEKTKYYASLSYANQEGITLNSSYERFTGRTNLSHTAGRFVFDFSTMFSKTNQNQVSEGTSFASPIMCVAMTCSPSDFPYNEDGSFSSSFPALNGANIMETLEYNYDRNSLNRSLNTASATWNIWDNLRLKEVFSYDFVQSNNRVWWDPRSNDGRTSKGVYQRFMLNQEKWSSQTQLTYAKTIAEKHTVDVLAGFETEDYLKDYTYANGNDYPGILEEIVNAATTRASSLKEGYRMTSILGRLNYDYDNKYYFSASFRTDGSSRLSRDSRWGNFWSVSGSWRLSGESFMQSLKNVLTDAKVRASYGVNGTQPTDYYSYMGIYEYGYNYNGKPGSAETRLLNPNLKWEKNYATNIGLDLTLWDRLSVSLDWYNRETKDLLMKQPISLTTGLREILKNVGSMRNRGIELELKSTNVSNKDWLWTTSFNISHNKNELTKLDGKQTEIIEGRLIHRVGESYYSFYAYEYAGVDPQTGKESFYLNDGSANARATTTNSAEAQKVIVGNAEPTVQGGLSSFLSWKFIDLNLTFTYSFGGHVYDDAGWLQSDGGTYHYIGNVPDYYKPEDMWQHPGDHAKLPQFVMGNTNTRSSRWLLSTDHVRLKNATLGFSLPKDCTQRLGLNKVRVYIAANNLFTIKSKDLYVDPETPAEGLVVFETPALRTVTFGVELGF